VLLFYVVLLAMVALFLALRLYSVLGKRTGHEQQPLARSADDRPLPVTLPRATEAAQASAPVANRNIDPRAEQGLRAVIAGEAGFDVAQFLNGAQAAYRMTLEAFWKGDARPDRRSTTA
jgi:predicted lipid-binding transport protein (Tim44 family)